jgi:hypothetical protein
VAGRSVNASNRQSRQNQPPAWRWLAAQILGLIRQFGSTVIWASVVIFFIYEAAHTLQAFAGKTSVASLIFNLAAKLNATVEASVALTGVSLGLYLMECRRHIKTRKRLTERNAALELRLDPNRESSLLTPEGATRRGDL